MNEPETFIHIIHTQAGLIFIIHSLWPMIALMLLLLDLDAEMNGNRIAYNFSYFVQYQNRIFVLLMTWKNIKLTVDIDVIWSECCSKSEWPSTNKLDFSIIMDSQFWILANVSYEWFHFVWWRFRFDLDHYSSSLRNENIINSDRLLHMSIVWHAANNFFFWLAFNIFISVLNSLHHSFIHSFIFFFRFETLVNSLHFSPRNSELELEFQPFFFSLHWFWTHRQKIDKNSNFNGT